MDDTSQLINRASGPYPPARSIPNQGNHAAGQPQARTAACLWLSRDRPHIGMRRFCVKLSCRDGVRRPSLLRGIRDVGEVQAGQRVLVNGAGGGVGTYAVQIAAALGAEVTGVCSTRSVELVRSLGAAHVVDYTAEDFTDGPTKYDVIFDNVSSLPLARLRAVLAPKGTLVLNGGGSPGHLFGPVAGILRAVVANAFVSQRLRPLPSRQNRGELLAVTGLIEDGKLMPVVDRTYPLADTVEGLRYVEQGHARGKVVVTVA